MKFSYLIIFGMLFALTEAAIVRTKKSAEFSKPTCGYESCTKSDPDKLNIHLVAHTHDDVGWLKTVDQYYYGEKMDVQKACVEDIINSVVDALVRDPNRKFIYVEVAFLWKWLSLESEEKREIMRNLINEGRLEIIGGGWSMNDEAVTHYRSMIDQYTWGFRRLNDTFGECARPKIGWQIDPFGHSREQASMFAQLGFDGLLFGRLDYQDKDQRLRNKTAEFIWEGSPNLGPSANIFTSILYHLYQPPDGFCFDTLCESTEQINDDFHNENYNLHQKVKQFLEFVNEQAGNYTTNNIILTMGGDFTYQDAELYYSNIDKLINGINNIHGKKYKAFYSTPSCYLKAVNEQNLTWSSKSDDFFPYANEPNAYWTGYYTSRPTLKFFERMGNNFLQVVKQLSSVSYTPDSLELELFREAMGVLQHHDAVTGTEKQHVAEDYARILYDSMTNGQRLASDALRKLAKKKQTHLEAEFHTCFQLNVSLCSYSAEHSKFVVTVYNPTSQPIDTYVRLPIEGSKYTVLDYNGNAIVTQIVPIPIPVIELPARDGSRAQHELVFQAINVAPFGYQSFYVKRESRKDNLLLDLWDGNLYEIGNQNYRVSVSDEDSILVQAPLGIIYEQNFEYYESANGVNMDHNRSSGAYIFRPANNYTTHFYGNGSFQIFKGPLVEEIHQTINNWTSQVVRLYKKENYVEFDWMVGPIPVDDNIGKEVISKYTGNLRNKDEFYTDSNGREMLKRKFNYRPTWKLELNETIAGNYYPVTAKISIEDEINNCRLSVLNDRAQGGSSIKEGEIELMIHRRMLNDDGFGVDEYLNETAYGHGLVARGQHILIAGSLQSRDELFLQEKEQAVKLALRPWIFLSPTAYTFEEWNEHYNMIVDGVIGQLPRNIHILTLEPWKDGYILLRLEHLFELNESPKYSVIMQVNLRDLFPKFNIISVAEMTLGANQYKEENQRLKWKAQNYESTNFEVNSLKSENDNFIVNLKPMEIRTFLIKLLESN